METKTKQMTLHEIGMKYGTDKATFHGYCDFYQENLPDRDFSGRLLEIGVWMGASLRMWREYYPKAEIVGVDIKIRTESIDGVKLYEMNSMDVLALENLGTFDIVFDDAGHCMLSQQVAFMHLYWRQLIEGGLYIMEDAQTSFTPEHINAKYTTYDIITKYYEHKEYNKVHADGGRSISLIVER